MTSGIVFRLCRNIREIHPGPYLYYHFNHHIGAFTGSMFTINCRPRWEASFNRKEPGTETKSCYWILRGNLQADKRAETGFAKLTRSFCFQKAYQSACTCAAYSESLVAKQKNKQDRAESQGWCGSRLEATASAGLPVQHLLCIQHHTTADMLPREPYSSKHNRRLLPSQGCSSQMFEHRKGLWHHSSATSSFPDS